MVGLVRVYIYIRLDESCHSQTIQVLKVYIDTVSIQYPQSTVRTPLYIYSHYTSIYILIYIYLVHTITRTHFPEYYIYSI